MTRLIHPSFIATSLIVAAFAGLTDHETHAADVTKDVFGRLPDGTPIDRYTLTNASGLEATVMTYGATLLTVRTPDRDGRLDHVTLHLDTLDDYLGGHPLFGSVVGRYANRIAGATFPLDGVRVELTRNAGAHHIHGGRRGFHKLVWRAAAVQRQGSVGVELTHTSPDGNEGYPGKLDVRVVYTLSDNNELRIEYFAQTDKPTVLNLTNHAYWNLAGAGSGDVLDHELTLHADHYLPSDEKKIPLGPISPVRGTPMDFTTPKTVGARIEQVDQANYDHCYVLNQSSDDPPPAARVVDRSSGRVMEVFTTQPGVQLYTAKWLSDRYRADGKPYGPYHGLCLETQHYPDSPNRPEYPSTVLRPGETFHQVTVHRFSTLTK